MKTNISNKAGPSNPPDQMTPARQKGITAANTADISNPPTTREKTAGTSTAVPNSSPYEQNRGGYNRTRRPSHHQTSAGDWSPNSQKGPTTNHQLLRITHSWYIQTTKNTAHYRILRMTQNLSGKIPQMGRKRNTIPR